MTPETFVKSQIAAFAQREGDGLGREAVLAIACVMRNRVRAGWFGGDWLDVLNNAERAGAYQPFLPSPVRMQADGFRELLVAVEDIYHGTYDDNLTRGGLYYFDPFFEEKKRQLRPDFIQEILVQGVRHPRVAQVGMLLIFK